MCFLGLCGVLLEFVFAFYISFLFEFLDFLVCFLGLCGVFWSLFLFLNKFFI